MAALGSFKSAWNQTRKGCDCGSPAILPSESLGVSFNRPAAARTFASPYFATSWVYTELAFCQLSFMLNAAAGCMVSSVLGSKASAIAYARGLLFVTWLRKR